MLTPSAEIDLLMPARSPGLSTQTTRILVEVGIFALRFQDASTRRVWSLAKTLLQVVAWIVTPRPRVINPVMLSPGIGLQHLASEIRISSKPLTRTLPRERSNAFLKIRVIVDSRFSSPAWSSEIFSFGRTAARTCPMETLPYPIRA